MNMRMHTVPTDRAERLSGTRAWGRGFWPLAVGVSVYASDVP